MDKAETLLEEKLCQELKIQNKFFFPKLKNLYLFAINHDTAPVVVREKFSLPESSLHEVFQSLKAGKHLEAFLVLSTCNRTEIYFVASDHVNALKEIFDFFKAYKGIEENISKEYNKVTTGPDVVEHVFRLASGLDSLVLGERQILSQIKEAYSISQKEQTLDDLLEKLFQLAIKCGKKVHRDTDISKNLQSIGSAAIDLANMISGPLKTKKIMVLGAGKMSRLALEHILRLNGSEETVVLNRSPHRVIEFSDKYKVDKTFPFENVYEVMNNVDIIVVASSAPHFILLAEKFDLVRKDPLRPLYIFDISMPRNVDSEFGRLPNVTLVDIDGVQNIYNQQLQTKSKDIDEVERIISQNVNKFYFDISNEELIPVIKDLKNRVKKVKETKLALLKGEKKSFTSDEVDYIVHNILNTILHTPIKNLKNSHPFGSQKEKIKVLRELFDL